MVKHPPANAGDAKDVGPPQGGNPGGGNCKPLQYPCLENAMDRGAWRAIFHGVAKSQTRLSIHPTQTAPVSPFFSCQERSFASCIPGRSLTPPRESALSHSLHLTLASSLHPPLHLLDIRFPPSLDFSLPPVSFPNSFFCKKGIQS